MQSEETTSKMATQAVKLSWRQKGPSVPCNALEDKRNTQCAQRSVVGYLYCIRHILHDEKAPFKQCEHFIKPKKAGASPQQCRNAIREESEHSFCTTHQIVRGMKEQRKRKGGEVEGGPPSSLPPPTPSTLKGSPTTNDSNASSTPTHLTHVQEPSSHMMSSPGGMWSESGCGSSMPPIFDDEDIHTPPVALMQPPYGIMGRMEGGHVPPVDYAMNNVHDSMQPPPVMYYHPQQQHPQQPYHYGHPAQPYYVHEQYYQGGEVRFVAEDEFSVSTRCTVAGCTRRRLPMCVACACHMQHVPNEYFQPPPSHNPSTLQADARAHWLTSSCHV